MKASRPIRAVRFDLPVDASGETLASAAGFRISPSGGLTLTDKNGAIRQAIMILLSTRPGERVMRPEYGCPLHRLVFEPNDAATAGLAIHYIRTALARWEPRIEIMSLRAAPDAETDADSGRMSVFLEYRVRATNEISRLQFNMDLQGQDNDAVSDA